MIQLLPDPRRRVRISAFAVLAVAVVITPSPWWLKLFGLSVGAFFLGSYRNAWLADAHFHRQLYVMFVPLPEKRWALDRCRAIDVRHADDSPVEVGMFLGNDWFVWQLLDWAVPWSFGKTRLRLRLDNGKRVLVWQGMSDENFEANLEILQEETGLPRAARDGTVSDEDWDRRSQEQSPG